jgi:hypothetical protein
MFCVLFCYSWLADVASWASTIICRSCIVCDEDATAELTVKTVKYFKGIQETMTTLLKAPMTGYSGLMTPKSTVTPVLFPETPDATAVAGGRSPCSFCGLHDWLRILEFFRDVVVQVCRCRQLPKCHLRRMTQNSHLLPRRAARSNWVHVVNVRRVVTTLVRLLLYEVVAVYPHPLFRFGASFPNRICP